MLLNWGILQKKRKTVLNSAKYCQSFAPWAIIVKIDFETWLKGHPFPGQSMSNWTKKMKKWKSPSPILMKLGTIDVLYGSMKWPNFEVAVTSRGLRSSILFPALRLSSLTFGGCIFDVYQDILKIPTPSSSQVYVFWANRGKNLEEGSESERSRIKKVVKTKLESLELWRRGRWNF